MTSWSQGETKLGPVARLEGNSPPQKILSRQDHTIREDVIDHSITVITAIERSVDIPVPLHVRGLFFRRVKIHVWSRSGLKKS